MKFMVGQRVIINKNIGTVTRPERKDMPNTNENVWVHCPVNGYPSYYAASNIKPLPNGQL